MKSSKNLRQQYGNSDRKVGSSKREKASKLDRKSSRGMIYENEELRLRTININAEVERGQSDIKRLRRENEQLRREIWTLRDECDRLNKRFKAKLLDYECNARHSGCSVGGRGSGNAACDSNCNSEDSDSCDTCKGNDDQCSDECCTGGSCPQLAVKQPIVEFSSDLPKNSASRLDMANLVSNSTRAESESVPNLHQTFDHLSVVSEETMSNADLHSHVPHTEMLHIYTPDSGGSQMTLPSLIGPLTPLTPIEQVANQLNDLQSNVPPLSYFENVLQDHMGSNIGNTPNAYSPTSKIMRHTNGWDYKMQSPFAHRKLPLGTSPPALQIATPSPNTKQHPNAPSQLLTTFVSTNGVTATSNDSTSNGQSVTVTAPSINQPNKFAIETVAITTTPAHVPPILNSPKHFFAPLKPRLKLNTALANKIDSTIAAADAEGNACQNCEPPDLYVHNGLASPYQHQSLPTMNAIDTEPPPIPQRGSSSQTESVNLETILNDIQAISEDILAIQLDKRKGNDNGINKPLEPNDKTKKPYRSEMNLTLQYDGANQAAIGNKTATATQTSFNGGSNGRCTRSLERDHTDSPSPHIPDAMMPFPDKRTYIGFDQLNNDAISALSPASIANMQRPPLPPVAAAALKTSSQTQSARAFPTSLNIRCAGAARGTPVSIPQPPSEEQVGTKNFTPKGVVLTPNKSQLYSAVANAAAKRAQYRSTTTHSLDVELAAAGAAPENEANTPDAASEALNSEAARRKARRVSIACGDSSTPESPDPVSNSRIIRSQAQINLNGIHDDSANNTTTTNSNTATTTTITNPIHTSISSCSDLPSALSNPALKNLKQTSHSTPNSPHSLRRRSNSNTMNPNNGVTEVTYPQSLSANTSPRHTANVHHHRTNSSCSNLSAQQRNASQDSAHGNPTEMATAEAGASRSRCSRRHSDGTVASNTHRISGASGHHHHHHHHHRHQHSTSVLSNNPHHSHHSHQDSTSFSEHGSNSSGSSHESSNSFSVRSHRRKLSISSHTGGKIPWCGCWGNGCL